MDKYEKMDIPNIPKKELDRMALAEYLKGLYGGGNFDRQFVGANMELPGNLGFGLSGKVNHGKPALNSAFLSAPMLGGEGRIGYENSYDKPARDFGNIIHGVNNPNIMFDYSRKF